MAPDTAYLTMASPVGALLLAAEEDALAALRFAPHAPDAGWRRDDGHPLLAAARDQLDAYFAGARTTFDLPLAPRGTTFQQRVWSELQRIPHGATISYGELARRVGDPRASRAVGAANGRNPIAIVVPCHRVIGSAGALTGFGGGIERKRWLLAHEGARLLELFDGPG